MSASSNDVEEISTLYNRIWDEYFKKLFSRKIHTKIIMIGLLFGFTIPLLLQIVIMCFLVFNYLLKLPTHLVGAVH